MLPLYIIIITKVLKYLNYSSALLVFTNIMDIFRNQVFRKGRPQKEKIKRE